MRDRRRGRGRGGRAERARAAWRSDGSLRGARAAGGFSRPGLVAAVRDGPVRDFGAVRDVRWGNRAGARAAGGVRGLGPEGGRLRERTGRDRGAATEPPAGGGGGTAGRGVGGALARLLRD